MKDCCGSTWLLEGPGKLGKVKLPAPATSANGIASFRACKKNALASATACHR